MASTDQIIQAASELGKLIATHETGRKFADTVRKLEADVEAQRILNDYNRHLMSLAQKEQAGQPIEVEDKHKVEQLQSAMAQNALLREFQMVQMDYLDLMRRVEEAMAPKREAPDTPAVAESQIVNPDLAG